MTENKKKALIFAGLLTLLLATTPIFFDIYRTAAFNTIARDDYAPYILSLLGQGDNMPGAPFAYRIISYAIAIPFYRILPLYTFSNLSNVDTAYLRATQALSFISYLSLVLIAVVIYAIARKQYHATQASSLIASLLTFFLGNFVSKTGIDPFAILIIGLLALLLNNPPIFVLLVLASIGINEKIPIIFAVLFAARFIICMIQRRRFTHYIQMLSSFFAVVGYFAMIAIFKVPGSENQTDPTLYLTNLQSTIRDSLSLKGLVLDILPVIVLSLIVILAIKSRQQSSFHISDVSSLFVLLILTFITDVGFNVGRIVMYSYPLYLPAAACFIDTVLEMDGASKAAKCP